jgi:hypothetical protein
MEEWRNAYRDLVSKPEVKKELGRSRLILHHIILMPS